jgi:hypothetical protein
MVKDGDAPVQEPSCGDLEPVRLAADSLEELEERLEMQILEGGSMESICIWFVCVDVCPPDGQGI